MLNESFERLSQGSDYKLILPEDEPNSVHVELMSGEYSGVVYTYGKVSVNEDVDRGEAIIGFEYEIVESNGHDDLSENVDFKNRIGDVLTTLISTEMKEV